MNDMILKAMAELMVNKKLNMDGQFEVKLDLPECKKGKVKVTFNVNVLFDESSEKKEHTAVD